MAEDYFNLKRKLEELGYNNSLPLEAVPLVECVLADLLQTTRSLQHYMDLSKEALMQRDSLMLEAEPYKCDNAKLIQENNQLHKHNMKLKEEYLKLSKDSKRKIKTLSDELTKKESLISKLQHDIRDLSLRGLCAGTQSSRNKSRRKDCGDDNVSRVCFCNDKLTSSDSDITELTKKIQSLEEKNGAYFDEISLLKSQIEHRDNEIIRLNILLEGGRPLKAVTRDVCSSHTDKKVQDLLVQLQDIAAENNVLRKQVADALEKQHEAMKRALNLADRNKTLHDELKKMDSLALTVEDDCNKRMATMSNEMSLLQAKAENLVKKNSELMKEISQSPKLDRLQLDLNIALREKESLQQKVADLTEVNNTLQDKILSFASNTNSDRELSAKRKCPTKDELQKLLEEERKRYEQCMMKLQDQLTETTTMFNTHLSKCKDKSPRTISPDTARIKNLYNQLCESQQKILMLKKENEELKAKSTMQDEGYKQNYKDVISQLNVENAELSKENISLSNQLSQYKSMKLAQYNTEGEYTKRDILKLQDEVDRLRESNNVLRKDKEQYITLYKESTDLVEKLKRDLTFKHREIEQLQEENSSYKMTHRTGKASADHLKEECHFLREQIKRMQSDVIKEKTLANQIKNIQMETERSSNEVQSELFCTQKKLSLSKDTIESLQRKCNDLQSDITSLNHDKAKLMENLKKIDKDRDKLVLDLDHKTEAVSILEQKVKSQSHEINKLEDEITELKRRLNLTKISEHKLEDFETQIQFLNGEILRLNQQYDNAVMENKHLQNSLAEANGSLKLNKIEYEKSRREVDGLKQQLQHYVAEIRRIEEMLSQKEAERSDMLEHFASLSVEANILENTNHSLESESASKSLQLQTYISKIQDQEERLLDKDNTIDAQSAKIATMTCRIIALENEVKLVTEEKALLEQNVSYLKQMCSNLQKESGQASHGLSEADSELQLYENKIKSLSKAKARLEEEKHDVKGNLETTEKLLANARREVVELKLALQDATAETKSLQDRINRLSRVETEIHDSTLTRELELPLMLEETIHEVSHEEDEDSTRFHEIHKRFSKYSHGSTL
ncbi:centrosomal protein of 135 kDa-like [Leguminivora glycinivorella]|uniref:centrosomal protein of 135 kDa-like n=1 Tax=Leguminivora glycinivorella TaxID=1035111 RepID=UPI00200E663B|nr:centrosomal protein of 135 kDa-like [Leguminivora glycinivorella]